MLKAAHVFSKRRKHQSRNRASPSKGEVKLSLWLKSVPLAHDRLASIERRCAPDIEAQVHAIMLRLQTPCVRAKQRPVRRHNVDVRTDRVV